VQATIDRWKPPTGQSAARKSRLWIAFVVVPLLAAGAYWSAPGPASAAAATCETEAECRTALERAVEHAEACLFSCGDESDLVALQRVRLAAAMEAQALQVHAERQRVFDTARTRERERQRDDEWRREKEAQAILHRQRLELLEARAAAEQLAEEARRERHVSYLRRLTREQRAARLAACRAGGQQCDELTERLLRAATSPAEVRALVELNEAPSAPPRDAS
jgi:hypothetical protein